MRTKVKFYRIYQKHYGEIPVDEDGRRYDIHHIDGNSHNNDISNLVALSIKDHYLTHLSQGDWGAARMISRRMRLDHSEISNLQSKIVNEQIKNGRHNWSKRGEENCNYDNTIHSFEHIFTGEIIKMTQHQFLDFIDGHHSNQGNVSEMIRGERRTCKNWKIFGTKTPPEFIKHTFTNLKTNETVFKTQNEMVNTYSLNRGHVCQMIKRNPKVKSVKGWVIL